MTCVILLACSGDYLVGNTYSYSVTSSIDLLQWAPLRLKVKPYLTFLNQYYQPTWRTRHPNTLERESLRHLRLPRGAPFALACGACFQTSRLEANLTMEVLPSREYYYRPKMNGRGQIRKYTVNRLTCLLSYLQINPLNDSGRIVCSLNRGRHTHTDTITFSLLDDVAIVEERVEEAEENAERIEKTDEKLEKVEKTDEKFENNVGEAEKKPDGRADDVVSRVVPYAGGKRTTELHCPSPKESWASSLVWSATNPLVYVWYFDPNPGNVVIPKLQPVITLPTPR
ncbi:hypothetical protein Pmani_021351 [Petrolisthes manimaculis]|uniref:Uncharacterized protein n=1 Tax=Petrolisthes manimaculis TaxID=1843537 RepID=A0AAE1PEZ7_9EUCA|nr:hypothetical protein Pmani_021351 [Petrolisthes manimaculis]